ncbi:hypothetical protein YPPY91_0747, partial [Yersinia pestis PY-91]
MDDASRGSKKRQP